MRTLLLHVGLRNDLGREVEPFTEVVQALGGQGVVVPLPGELGLQVTTRGERLASLDNLYLNHVSDTPTDSCDVQVS